MEFLRTPDERFERLAGYPYRPHYIEVGDGLRMHYVHQGPRDAPPVLLLHGEPTWSYLYRHMIAILAEAGYRVIAPDLIGFGRSDKPTRPEDYTYERHVQWLRAFVTGLDLKNITMVCQDWGGLLGLRVLASDAERFARVVASNTFLPTGDEPLPAAFETWRQFSRETELFDAGAVVQMGTKRQLAPEVTRAYNAPFPDASYKVAARQFPQLVPSHPDAPSAAENRAAWTVLRDLQTPFLTAFSDQDPITAGADAILQERIPGAANQAHTIITGGGHFLQEDRGPELAYVVLQFMADNASVSGSLSPPAIA